MNKRGFTLIELVMVIVILGILAAVSIPRYIDLQEDAKRSAALGMVAEIQAAVNMKMADNAVKGIKNFSGNHWPTDITADMFSDGKLPINPVNGRSGFAPVSHSGAESLGNFTHSNSQFGFWYVGSGVGGWAPNLVGQVGAFGDDDLPNEWSNEIDA